MRRPAWTAWREAAVTSSSSMLPSEPADCDLNADVGADDKVRNACNCGTNAADLFF